MLRDHQEAGAAELALQADSGGSVCQQDSGSSSVGQGRGSGRSQGQLSDVSSHLFAPSWRRLLRAIASTLASRIEESEGGQSGVRGTPSIATNMRLEGLLMLRDGAGGGSAEDLKAFLSGILEELGLQDKESGFLLLHMFYYLQPRDLNLSDRTWRTLVMTAVAVAIGDVSSSQLERESARDSLMGCVKHWWSPSNFKQAEEAFVSRDCFKSNPPSRSDLVQLYFELRDSGLHMAPDDSSDVSGAAFETSSIGSDLMGGSSRGGSERAGAARSAIRSMLNLDGSNSLSASSLRFSETDTLNSSCGSLDFDRADRSDREIRRTAKDSKTKSKVIVSL